MPCISVSGRSAHGSHLHGYLLQLLMSMNEGLIHRLWRVRYFFRLPNSRCLARLLILRWLAPFKNLPCGLNM